MREQIIAACHSIAQSWPMKTFAYRNPLRGWEHLPFDTAVHEGKQLIAGNGQHPTAFIPSRRRIKHSHFSEVWATQRLCSSGLTVS